MAVYTTPEKVSDRETLVYSKINAQWVESIKALYDRLAHEVTQAVDIVNAWTLSNSAGVWGDDTCGLVISLTLEVASNVIIEAVPRWYCATAQTEAMKFRIKNNTDTTYGDSLGYIGEEVANTRIKTRVIGYFANVAAGTKVFRLQGSRVTSGVSVTVLGRRLTAKAYSVAS